MLEDLLTSWVSYEEFRKYANEFLNEYHPENNLPIPIDEIIEFQIKLDIIPTPGLKDNYDIDGWLSSDLSSIYVDKYQYTHFENRYRFTLAHEISHYILHKKVYDSTNIKETEDYIEFIKQLEETGLVSNFEWQANNLAGLILVPQELLFQEAKRLSSEYIGKISIDINKHAEAFWDNIKWKLSKVFNVSNQTIDIRFQKDRISKKIKLS